MRPVAARRPARAITAAFRWAITRLVGDSPGARAFPNRSISRRIIRVSRPGLEEESALQAIGPQPLWTIGACSPRTPAALWGEGWTSGSGRRSESPGQVRTYSPPGPVCTKGGLVIAVPPFSARPAPRVRKCPSACCRTSPGCCRRLRHFHALRRGALQPSVGIHGACLVYVRNIV